MCVSVCVSVYVSSSMYTLHTNPPSCITFAVTYIVELRCTHAHMHLHAMTITLDLYLCRYFFDSKITNIVHFL